MPEEPETTTASSAPESEPEPETENTPPAIENPPIESQESFAASQLVDGGDATLAMDHNRQDRCGFPLRGNVSNSFNAGNIPEEDTANDNRQTSDSFSALSALSGAPTGESMSRDGFVSSLAGGAGGKLVRGSTSNAANPDKEYINAPAGEATRVFMATAGVFDRQRKRKRAAIISSIVGTILTSIIMLDLFGIYTIPGFGLLYDYTGLEDPNVGRAEQRVEAKLQDKELSPEERKRLELERKRLREKLLGLNRKPAKPTGVRKATKVERVEESRGIEDKGDSNLTESQRKMAMSVFGDKRKRRYETGAARRNSLPNLPDGLSPEALYEVLRVTVPRSGCVSQKFTGERKLKGRMVQIEIKPTSSVNNVSIATSTPKEQR